MQSLLFQRLKIGLKLEYSKMCPIDFGQILTILLRHSLRFVNHKCRYDDVSI